jgi:hypothetical protein
MPSDSPVVSATTTLAGTVGFDTSGGKTGVTEDANSNPAVNLAITCTLAGTPSVTGFDIYRSQSAGDLGGSPVQTVAATVEVEQTPSGPVTVATATWADGNVSNNQWYFYTAYVAGSVPEDYPTMANQLAVETPTPPPASAAVVDVMDVSCADQGLPDNYCVCYATSAYFGQTYWPTAYTTFQTQTSLAPITAIGSTDYATAMSKLASGPDTDYEVDLVGLAGTTPAYLTGTCPSFEIDIPSPNIQVPFCALADAAPTSQPAAQPSSPTATGWIDPQVDLVIVVDTSAKGPWAGDARDIWDAYKTTHPGVEVDPATTADQVGQLIAAASARLGRKVNVLIAGHGSIESGPRITGTAENNDPLLPDPGWCTADNLMESDQNIIKAAVARLTDANGNGVGLGKAKNCIGSLIFAGCCVAKEGKMQDYLSAVRTALGIGTIFAPKVLVDFYYERQGTAIFPSPKIVRDSLGFVIRTIPAPEDWYYSDDGTTVTGKNQQ